MKSLVELQKDGGSIILMQSKPSLILIFKGII